MEHPARAGKMEHQARAGKMEHQARAFATKLENLSLIPGTHVAK